MGEAPKNLKAIIEALNILKDEIIQGLNIIIVSDSEYAIKCATTYGYKVCNGKIPKDKTVPNIELVKELYSISFKFKNIQYKHIEAHTENKDKHSIGNYNADLLANLAIGKTADIKNKIYLNVPFANKDEAKVLGAKWDASKKKWYSFDNNKNKDKLLQMFS